MCGCELVVLCNGSYLSILQYYFIYYYYILYKQQRIRPLLKLSFVSRYTSRRKILIEVKVYIVPTVTVARCCNVGLHSIPINYNYNYLVYLESDDAGVRRVALAMNRITLSSIVHVCMCYVS